MHIHQVEIKNFRLLADAELVLEEQTTVIVGRNNSGKTSLSEIIRRFLADGSATFQLEDFSSSCYDRFVMLWKHLRKAWKIISFENLFPPLNFG